MLEGEEINQQDANLPESSEPVADSTPQAEQSPAQPAEAAPTQSQKPFHEDPRIQEYLERQTRKLNENWESRMSDFQRQQEERMKAFQTPQAPKQVNPFVQKLREIDPAYADYIESLEGRASKVETLEQKLDRIESDRLMSQYESTVDKLHAENKVPESDRQLIRKLVDAAAVQNPKIGLRDLPRVYKEVQSQVSQLMEARERAVRASYVQAKTQDASTPASQPKGKSPARNDKGQFTGSREEMLSQIAQRAAKSVKAGSDF